MSAPSATTEFLQRNINQPMAWRYAGAGSKPIWRLCGAVEIPGGEVKLGDFVKAFMPILSTHHWVITDRPLSTQTVIMAPAEQMTTGKAFFVNDEPGRLFLAPDTSVTALVVGLKPVRSHS